MFSASTALLAFLVGIVGSIFGGTQTFIVTGFVGLFIYTLQAVGIQSEFLSETLMNTVFLPAIIFNAASVSTAYAAKHYDIEGWDINHSLLFTHDPIVSLLAGFGGVAGYLVFAFARGIGLPADQGSFSVILIGILTRIFLGNGRWTNPNATAYYKKEGIRYWVFQTINYLAVSIVFALLLKEAGPAYYGMGFNISALLLIFGYAGGGQKVPTTHQITCILGTALGLTSGNIFVAVLFGWISNMIYLLFARYFNEDCSTHIDPPAVAIAVVTMLLKVFF